MDEWLCKYEVIAIQTTFKALLALVVGLKGSIHRNFRFQDNALLPRLIACGNSDSEGMIIEKREKFMRSGPAFWPYEPEHIRFPP